MAKSDATRLRRTATTLVVLSAFVPTAVLLGGRATADVEMANQQSFGDVSSESAPAEEGVAQGAGDSLAPDVPLSGMPPSEPSAGDGASQGVSSDGVPAPELSAGDPAAQGVSPGATPSDLSTGSAAAQDVSPDGAPPTGSASGQDAASGDPPAPVDSTGSAVLDSASTGSAFDENSLSLEPPPALGGILRTGSAGYPAHELALSPTPVAETTAADPVLLGLDSGSLATACTGSALSGGFGLLAGSAAGSGFIGPGSFAPPWWIPIGSAGSLWLPPGFGSSGSALGSAIVGSAVTGSALVTCMLTIVPGVPPPVPAFPPLLLFPPLPGGVVPGGVVTVSAPAGAAQGATAPAPFVPHLPAAGAGAGSAVEPAGWNTIEIMTLLILVILMGYGSSSTAAARKPPL